MAAPPPTSNNDSGGFWNAPKVTYSPQTHALLKEMMQESKLTNFQQRHLESRMRTGEGLPSKCNPTSSADGRRRTKKSAEVVVKKNTSGIRTRDAIEASGAYERPKYISSPHKGRTDLDKRKFANVMAFGTDCEPVHPSLRKQPSPEPEQAATDRFDELLAEIEERRKFLEEMEKLGQGKKYRTIIETEISQKIAEMETIDKKRTKELEKRLAEEDAANE